jgi:hypothetical protein
MPHPVCLHPDIVATPISTLPSAMRTFVDDAVV